MQALAALRRRLEAWVQLTVLRRPSGPREALNRAAVVAAVAAAVIAPIFIGGDAGELTEGAAGGFAEQLEELDRARADLEILEADGRGDSGEAADLSERIAALETATFLGYIERDGDAARRDSLAPDFRLLTLDGEPVRLADAGRPVVLNFWASWCQPCIEEMPDFQLVHEEYGDRIALIGVNDGEDLATAREFAGRTGVRYQILLDPTKALTDGPYRLVGRPTTYYIDADGIIRDIRVGFHSLEDMRETAAALLGESPPPAEPEAEAREYREQALELLDSMTANFTVAADLFERAAADPALRGDPAWRRNIQAQARIWLERTERWAALDPPEAKRDLHEAVANPLNIIRAAADLVARGATPDGDPDTLASGIAAFQDARADYQPAAADLQDVLNADAASVRETGD